MFNIFLFIFQKEKNMQCMRLVFLFFSKINFFFETESMQYIKKWD